MEPMNAFIASHRDEFKDYLDQICAISTDQSASRVPPASYTAPIQIFSRLPRTSKEGFASLPYLVDQPRELAILVNSWVETTDGHRPTEQDGDELVAFDRMCYALRDRTRDTVNNAMRAVRPNSATESILEETIGISDLPKRMSTYADYNVGSPRSMPSGPQSSSSAATFSGPISTLTRAARRFKMNQSSAEIRRNNSSVSLPSPRDSSAFPSPVSPQHDYTAAGTGSSSPFAASPTVPGSASASGVWDPGTDRDSGDNFPTHALAWDSSSGGHGVEVDDAYSAAVDSDVRPSRSPRTVDSTETSARSLDVEDGRIREEPGVLKGTVTTTIMSGNSQLSPVSPREGRRLVDVWGFRKRDKEKERDKDKDKDKERERERERARGRTVGSDARKVDIEGARKSMLTKKDRESEKSNGKGRK